MGVARIAENWPSWFGFYESVGILSFQAFTSTWVPGWTGLHEPGAGISLFSHICLPCCTWSNSKSLLVLGPSILREQKWPPKLHLKWAQFGPFWGILWALISTIVSNWRRDSGINWQSFARAHLGSDWLSLLFPKIEAHLPHRIFIACHDVPWGRTRMIPQELEIRLGPRGAPGLPFLIPY